MHYIGNTQQKLKERMNQHFSETARLVNDGVKSDSFVNHFASHFSGNDKDVTRQTIRKMVKMDIIWQGDAISCMKSFGHLSCQLCMAERLAILKKAKEEPDKLINSRLEIYGSCRHKTRFHRYTMNGLTSTDDGDNPERALRDLTNANATKPKPPPGDLQFCMATV